MSDTVHHVATDGTAGAVSADDQSGHDLGPAGYAQRARQTNVRPVDLLPVRPVARRPGVEICRSRQILTKDDNCRRQGPSSRLITPAMAARRNRTFSTDPSQIATDQKVRWNFDLLSNDTKAETQLYQNNFQSYGLCSRDVLIGNPLITVPERALRADRLPALQASKHVSSNRIDGLENPLTANTRKAAGASGGSGETSFMNRNGMLGDNGNFHSFRFMSAASQR